MGDNLYITLSSLSNLNHKGEMTLSVIRIVTDSTADLPESVIEKYNIKIVSLKVNFGEETYLDGKTITTEDFYVKLQNSSQLPTTSQPSPIDFVDTYKAIAEETPDAKIISIHLSSALSGTYQSALLAKSMLEDMEITVVDSLSASYGLGFAVLAAAEAAEEGKSAEACVQEVKKCIADQQIYFLVDELTYLQKGGRIGKAAALLGAMLNIKPILSVDEKGEVFPLDRVRGSKKAQGRILELMQKEYGSEPVRIAVCHCDAENVAKEWGETIRQQFNVKELVISSVGPVIGVHTGPGTIAAIITRA
jgi:DegV family protein with EDD domain